ncbi:2-succinyl-6-hydroxy-2,4-cyclohexadiene-1-carboxylate synthase [Lottiidibacillus patelloidae]|uniref:2-succinyl-6-hydroxy-2, 4-cyclohexadiene-1-carboxylate synthase n=1 Tax=Lottiidibacillus patelloidae TaxID=2670334 RepID=A0A263BW54_9BACI|nr:alpha/beta hydrolase [Lottiidibacillus patelloidae]OZM57557.1 2-succinyl-6-hydroxy-2,4-cyclohexadiene-1-carboxylate synthase [Lottiidibacillus patelloidae]
MLYYKTYEEHSNADWVVFIHGAGGSSSIWYKQLKAFKKHFNLLLIDLRGHGQSKNVGNGNEKYTYQLIGSDIIEVLDHLSIKKAHFLGISLGSIIINSICIHAPERILSMTQGGAIPSFNKKGKLLILLGNLTKYFLPYMFLYRLFAFVLMPKNNHKRSRKVFTSLAKKVGKKEFIRWFRTTSEVETLHEQALKQKVAIPKLYIMGREDHMFLAPVLKSVATEKHASIEIIEQSGHVCNIEKAKKFNEIAIKFIESHSVSEKKMASNM